MAQSKQIFLFEKHVEIRYKVGRGKPVEDTV
jgi:hypothetical protein